MNPHLCWGIRMGGKEGGKVGGGELILLLHTYAQCDYA